MASDLDDDIKDDPPALFDLKDNETTRTSIHVLAKLFCTKEEAAAQFRVSVSSFRDFLHRYPDMARAWTDGAGQAKVSLRRKQFKLAEKNVGMAIFLGKNYLGQKDFVEAKPEKPEGLPRAADTSKLSPDDMRELERLIAMTEDPDEPATGADSAGTGRAKSQGLH